MAYMRAMILDVNGAPLDPLWAAEFRGYFFGDGFLGVVRNGKNRGRNSYTARAQITTRDDDAAMLHDIALHFGGRVYEDDFKKAQDIRNPVVIWRTRNMSDVMRVCDVLDDAIMPSKKREEVKVVRRFLAIKLPHGPYGPSFDYEAAERKREACIAELQRLHAYRKPL